MPVTQHSPRPLRPLTFLRVSGSLGHWESASGPEKSQATESIDISQGHGLLGRWESASGRQSPRPLTYLRVTRSLGRWESASGLAKSRTTEATDISQGVTGSLVTGTQPFRRLVVE